MNKRIYAVLLCMTILLSFLPVNARAASTIDKISLTLDYPEAGKTPPMTATWHGTGYNVYDIEWFDCSEDRFLETGDRIQANHQYTATIWVEAQDGYEFQAANDNTPSISASVNGQWVEPVKAFEYKAWAMVTLTYYFSAVPAKGWIKSVDLNIPAPVAGDKPFYEHISTGSYALSNVYFSGETNPKMKNGIAWYPTATGDWMTPATAVFDANTAYTLHCLVFPNEGYRFTNDAVIRVNGNVAESSLDYDTFQSVTYHFPATGNAHAHTPSDWRTTQVYHYTVCTTCGDMLEQEDHYGGVSSCAEPMICSACGYAYKEAHENHTPDTSKWVARAEMYHFHKCSVCGAHCDIEEHRWSPRYHAVDASGHAYQCADCKGYDLVKPHTPGPAATESTPQTCTECGYIITPATNHKHELTRVPQTPADCTHAGNIEYYFCVGCNDCFTDAAAKNKIPEYMSVEVGALGHTVSNFWSCDGEYHWRTCTICSTVLDETRTLHEEADGKCTTCGYVTGSGSTVQEDPGKETKPTASDVDEAPSADAPNSQISLPIEIKNISWAMVVMIGLVCFGASITATVIILKSKEK